jgi:hypothetical protein
MKKPPKKIIACEVEEIDLSMSHDEADKLLFILFSEIAEGLRDSDNLYKLRGCSVDELRWIDALRAIDTKKNYQPLLDLMAVPENVKPFVADLFERTFHPKPGRPATPLYAALDKVMTYERAIDQMKDLINEGQSPEDAAATVAPKWSLEATALVSAFLGKHSHYRTLRRR